MRSKIKLLLLLVLIAHQGFSQRAKLNPSLFRAVMSRPASSQVVSLLVQGDPSVIRERTKLLGGTFKFSIDNIASVSMPINKVTALSQTEGISRIEGLYGRGQTFDEKTLINANVNPVHLGYAPLQQAYDGSGVIMAFLDAGIDFRHPDFQNADGTTRIKYIWDQVATSGGIIPQPYNYGQEWTSSVIDAGTCPYYETWTQYGHGSNVAGIGAGNGSAINNLMGVAPNSDIIAVAVSLDENFLNNVVDATEYAFAKAALIGKPCVINASLGTYFGSHDGYDLAAQIIDDLITLQNGRSFVCAAGNAGNIPFHLGYDTHPDSSFTWFTPVSGTVNYEWWIDKDDAQNFQFAIGADNPSPFAVSGRTQYFNLVNDFDYVSGFDMVKDTLYYNAVRIGIITFYSYEFDSTYACDVVIQPDFPTYYWRFITNGTGRFDLWSASNITGSSDMITTSLPSTATFPDIDRYHLPDVSQTIVSSFSCSDKVITVANYINRDQYLNYYGNLQLFTNPPGSLSEASSLGPTRDGRIKPEIAAPGDVTLSSEPLYLMDLFIASSSDKVALGGMHVRNGGTSMASPVVAGVAALYLQKNPNAGWKEIKDAIQLSAMKDNYTGNNLPDNTWGYGKVDAFSALTTTIVYGCTNAFSINFNPLATVDDGSCQPIIFGCNDPIALNYNAAANMNDGSCQYNVGIDDPLVEPFFACYPNPASTFSTFFFQLNEKEAASGKIVIMNVDGKTLDEIKLSSQQQYITYRNHLAAGLYFCRLQTDGNTTKVIKLLVQ